MEESDFVSVHASLTRETRGLIGWELLNRMKSESMLINTARGPIVDEESLVAVLKDRRIGGAALDAFTVEPLAADSPLRDLDNVLITPHQASFGLQTGEAVSRAAAVGVVDAMQGRPPVHLVNPEAWSHADHSEGTGA